MVKIKRGLRGSCLLVRQLLFTYKLLLCVGDILDFAYKSARYDT